MEKKVSVIIPMYNSEKYIIQCLNSVLHQTYKNIEIIIIDDCSQDASLKLVKGVKDERIKICCLSENKGPAVARNAGIKLATGEYICFIDSDDIWLKDKVEKQVKFMEENDYEFIYSNYAYFKDSDYNGEMKQGCKTANVPLSVSYKQAIKNTTITVITVMLNMNKLKKEDIYMPDLKIGQDTATWWKILKKGIVAHGMKDVLAYYRVNNKSLSSNKLKAVAGAWKIYSREKMFFVKRLYCFTCYVWNAVKRRVF